MKLKYRIRQTSLFSFLKSIKDKNDLIKWNRSGKPMPPPYSIKRKIMKDFAVKNNLTIFFESGTAAGDTVASIKPLFKKLYSVEINKFYFENCKKRFEGEKKIEILHGDSGKILASLMKDKINEPALFWLDGHYNSVSELKQDEQITPIFLELESIFNHSIKNHVILIDDARLFIGTNGYPTLDEVKRITETKRPDFTFYVENDIIHIHQK